MLKWISPKGNNPPTASPPRSDKTSNIVHNSSLPWLTDDPLATLNVNTAVLDTKRKSKALRRLSQQEQIYSVTRMNPLFVDSPKDMLAAKLTEGEKRLMDDSRSSNRSEQCHTPSSSGYESAADPDKRQRSNGSSPNHKHQVNHGNQQQHHQVDNHRHQRHYQQHLVKLSPASDYRRQFVLGPKIDRTPPSNKAITADVTVADGLIPRPIGRANLLHQNSHYVTRIGMVSASGTNKPSSTGTDEASKQRPISVGDKWDENYEHDPNDQPSTSHRTVPHPVWPSKNAAIAGRKSSMVTPSAIVQQNENYVTKIVISPRTVDTADDVRPEAGRVASADEDHGLDSIVTHSLLVMTSYDGQSTDDSASDSADASRQQCNKEDHCRIRRMTQAELSEIRQLSQTISQSRVVATVSRALSKNSDASTCSGSTPQVHCSYPASPTSKNEETHESATIGSSIARRISLMKERWDKNSRRRLLTESDDDDSAFSRRLDQVYVPENGDLNFSVGKQPYATVNDKRRNGGELCPSAFSYMAGTYHPTTIAEEVTTNDNEVLVAVTPNRMCMPSHQTNYVDPFEHDRLSNSSSRSSGSRRVTFSADTVDNEQSTKSTISTGSVSSVGSICGSIDNDHQKTSNHCPDIVEELKLNPHYLPQRYQQQSAPSLNAGVETRSGRLAGYYSYNLQAQLDNYTNRNGTEAAEKVSTWEHYHQQEAKKASSSSKGRPSGAIRLDPYKNLQLHPNYGAACQERSMCVDFTLDGVEEALLQRRSDSHKLRRRLCCCLLLSLCLVVLIIVVIVISLYLSQGQMIFGSLGPL